MVQVQVQARTTRVASPERWQKAAQRAIAEGIEVRQVNASGMWVANSGTQANVAYLLEITGTLVQACSCPAGTFGDPCCKHAARFYLDAGLLEIDDPEPDPPAPGASVSCWQCNGCGQEWYRGGYALPCVTCGGAGTAPLVAQAGALVAAAFGESCDRCGASLANDAEPNAALHTLCADCLDVLAVEAWEASQAAIQEAHRHHLAEVAAACVAA